MKCRICSGVTRRSFDLRSQRHGIVVPVFRCSACDAYFSDGGPVSYDDVDLTDYYMRHAPQIRRRYERLFAKIESFSAPGRFIDIGAGMGFSLEVAIQRGWISCGLEPNRALARHAQARGLDVEIGYLDGSQRGEYNLVLIDNVLEHILDPIGFLRQAVKLLAPSGLMVVAVPPMDWLRKGLAASACVRDCIAKPQLNIFCEVDEHVNMLGRRAMTLVARAVGLRLLPARFHHSKVFDNPLVRILGLDDGYYLIAHAPKD